MEEAPAKATVADDGASGGAESSRKSRNLRPFLLIAGAIAAILIVIWGVRFITYAMAHQSTDDAKVDADVVTITSKIGERVAAVLVDTNQSVRKGQLLIRLDDQDERAHYAQSLAGLHAQQAAVRAAEANVSLTQQTVVAQTQQGQGGISSAQSSIANAQQQVAVAQQGVAQARAQLSAAQAAVPAAREALAKANADFGRTSTLVGSGDVAKANLDTARAMRETAAAQYAQAQDNVTVAQTGVAAATQRVSAAQSQVGAQRGQLTTAQGKLTENNSPYRVSAQQAQAAAAQAQAGTADAELKVASDQLSYTQITSPIDGYVGLKSVDVGQHVAAGSPLMTIVPSNKVYITANFKETQIGNMHAGQQVDIAIDAYKGVKFSGHVATISPASQNTFALVPAQNASGNFVKVTQRIPVRILVDSASKPLSEVPLRPGMSADASVKVK